MSEWTNNEDGPECTCGAPTIVKVIPIGQFLEPQMPGRRKQAVLMCITHTRAEGVYFALPEERPDDWPWTIERVQEEAEKE